MEAKKFDFSKSQLSKISLQKITGGYGEGTDPGTSNSTSGCEWTYTTLFPSGTVVASSDSYGDSYGDQCD